MHVAAAEQKENRVADGVDPPQPETQMQEPSKVEAPSAKKKPGLKPTAKPPAKAQGCPKRPANCRIYQPTAKKSKLAGASEDTKEKERYRIINSMKDHAKRWRADVEVMPELVAMCIETYAMWCVEDPVHSIQGFDQLKAG